MQIPVQVTFRHLEYSSFVASAVRKKAKELEQYFSRMTSMRVMVEPLEKRRHQGNLYHIRINITLPGGEIVVGRGPGQDHSHEDIYVAIRDSFDAAKRQLEDYVRIHYREKKRHRELPLQGKVIRIFPNEDCGFLQSSDGREIYFHKNSVINGGFGKLHVGSGVRYVEESGEKGPQASTVHSIGKSGRSLKAA